MSDPEVEGGDEIGGLGDDVLELAGVQLPVVVDVRLEEDLGIKKQNDIERKSYTTAVRIAHFVPRSV